MAEEFKSAATIRMEKYYQGVDFHGEFRYSPAFGLEQTKGITRRDPTSVVYVDGKYHIWYTRSTGDHWGFDSGNADAKTWPWDQADLWHASSPDGVFWEEHGEAVTRGTAGKYDDRSVFTPEILMYEGTFFLVYQVVSHPYLRASRESIAMARADSPYGPWVKTDEPILNPSAPEDWPINPNNPLDGEPTGNFDDLRVHDPCLFFRKNQFWLYYKGEHIGEEWNMGGRDIRWGVAMADNPEGPYERCKYNPITNTGHETVLWPYREGMVALLTNDGPERETIQYAPDGINFEIKAAIHNPPAAAGPFRCEDTDSSPLDGFKWGMCHHVGNGYGYIGRFDTVQDKKIKRLERRIPF